MQNWIGPRNEWYLFSHKGKKYPTGTRTNRATEAGFWKANGREGHKFKQLQENRNEKNSCFLHWSAPHSQKTDWIMHEHSLDYDSAEIQLKN